VLGFRLSCDQIVVGANILNSPKESAGVSGVPRISFLGGGINFNRSYHVIIDREKSQA